MLSNLAARMDCMGVRVLAAFSQTRACDTSLILTARSIVGVFSIPVRSVLSYIAGVATQRNGAVGRGEFSGWQPGEAGRFGQSSGISLMQYSEQNQNHHS